MNEKGAYEKEIEESVREALARSPRNFEGLCRAVPGVFPTVITAVLRQTWATAPSRVSERYIGHINQKLPEPHPIDYEWRFDYETAHSLAVRLQEIGGEVCLFGAPTVFLAGCELGLDATLVDRNPQLLNWLPAEHRKRVIQFDLNSLLPEPKRPFDVLFMDAPWYPHHIEGWLANALRHLKPTGTLITTLFPSLTRPSARQERADLLSLFNSLGQSQTLEFRPVYETPLFEAEVLWAEGFSLPRWRTADLLKIQLSGAEPARPLRHAKEEPWLRYQVGSQVVAVRPSADDEADALEVGPCYENGRFLLRSVSARDPARSRIDVWTSRNRCAHVKGRRRLVPLLEGLEKDVDPAHLLRELPSGADEANAMKQILALIGW